MAETKTKIAQELTPEELAAFCAELAGVPHGEMAARIMAMAAERGISIGKSAAYEFRNKEAMPFIKRLQLRKEKAKLLKDHADDAGTDSAQTLADHAAGELAQIAFDFVSELDGVLDLTSKEGLETYDVLTKSIARLRSGDRQMIKQMQAQLEKMQAEKKAAQAIMQAAEKKGGISPETQRAIRKSLGMSEDEEL